MENGIKTVCTLYTEARAPGVATTCLKTCLTLINNAVKDPTNEKFLKVNLDNNAIKQRIATINGGLNILKGAGFENSDEGNFLVLKTYDQKVLLEAAKQLQYKLD